MIINLKPVPEISDNNSRSDNEPKFCIVPEKTEDKA
jgi:hypothetical protein